MTAKMTCRTKQRTGATLAVRTESSVTWWTAWSRTSCVHSWQLIALSDEDVCEDISECVHAECVAFFGREQARQHGVHVEKVVHSFRPKSELEIKTGARRAGEEEFDAQDLWRKGHWAGDQVCPNFVENRSIPGSLTRSKHPKGKDQPTTIFHVCWKYRFRRSLLFHWTEQVPQLIALAKGGRSGEASLATTPTP